MIIIGVATIARPAPSSITVRIDSINAVSGNNLMVGCTISGKRAAEKNTPEVTSMGRDTAFTKPATVCVFCARDPINNPIPANINEPRTHSPAISSTDPRIGTLNTQFAKQSSTGNSPSKKNPRTNTNESRK